jgi:hypothetical protein
MGITYSKCGDYLLPNITLSDPPDTPPLGKYGRMHKAFLKVHKSALYSQLLLSERLYPLCRAVDEAAAERQWFCLLPGQTTINVQTTINQ